MRSSSQNHDEGAPSSSKHSLIWIRRAEIMRDGLANNGRNSRFVLVVLAPGLFVLTLFNSYEKKKVRTVIHDV